MNQQTEMRNQATMHLDEMSITEVISVMNQEDYKVCDAIANVKEQIEQVITHVVESFNHGGRLIYVGAGTSGRLGVLDASECVPTFGINPAMVRGVIAGGSKALTDAVEDAEDSLTQAGEDLKALNLNQNDFVLGIAASGATPFVVGALEFAKSVGCKTGSISCNQDAIISSKSDFAIEAVVGPEILTGSTRLKSGTAQKLILNMISTISMVQIGKVYGNLMVDLQPSNKKLRLRSIRIVAEATGVSLEEAKQQYELADSSVKTAIVMILAGVDQSTAAKRLENSAGFVGKAIKS